MKIIYPAIAFSVLFLAGCLQKSSVTKPGAAPTASRKSRINKKDQNIPSLMIFLGRVYVEAKIITDESSFEPGVVNLEKSEKKVLDWAIEDAEEYAADYLQIQRENRNLACKKWRSDSTKLVSELLDIYRLIDKTKKEKPDDKLALSRLEKHLLNKRGRYEKVSRNLRARPEIKFRLKITAFSDSLDFVPAPAADLARRYGKLLPFPQTKNKAEKEKNKLFVSRLIAKKRAEEVYDYVRKRFKYELISGNGPEITTKDFRSGSNRRLCRYSLIPVTIN